MFVEQSYYREKSQKKLIDNKRSTLWVATAKAL